MLVRSGEGFQEQKQGSSDEIFPTAALCLSPCESSTGARLMGLPGKLVSRVDTRTEHGGTIVPGHSQL